MSKLWVGMIVEIDGAKLQLAVNGEESARELYAELRQHADDLGASPPREAAAGVPAPQTPETPGKRTRRTKEQIAADEAAKVAANTAPPMPLQVSTTAPVFAGSPVAHPPIASAFDSPPQLFPPLGGYAAPPVAMTSAPPVVSAPPSVGFAAPPAPPIDPAAGARFEVATAIKALYDSIPPAWRENATTALNTLYPPLAGELNSFDLVMCSEAKAAVAKYQGMCDAAAR